MKTMARPRTGRLLFASVVVVLTACSSMKSVTDDPMAAGEARSFDAPYEKVKLATLDGIRDLKLEPSETSETAEGFVVLISRTPHGVSWGEVGRIVVEKAAQPPTAVHVRYEKRFAVQGIGSESRFATALFKKIEGSLALGAPQQ
jgi:hypothetical protein